MDSINKLKKFLRSIDGQKRISIDECFNEKYEYFNGIGITLQKLDYMKYEFVKIIISVPLSLMRIKISKELEVFAEDYLLRLVSPRLELLNREYQNNRKDKRLQCELFLCPYDSRIIKRNASRCNSEEQEWNLTVLARVPCIGINSINGKQFSKFISNIVRAISEISEYINTEDYESKKSLFVKQQSIRRYLKEQGAVCFIANGSIIPRIENSDTPNEQAVRFVSPKSVEVTIELDSNTSVTGMLLKQGITVVVGGAYSGKSTLLDAIEEGIYDHISGDGRELILTDRSAIKANAEDGRPVNRLDLSPFFSCIPPKSNSNDFTTVHSSGSVSQAANVIEAVYCNSNLLLIDEDSSATNFLVHDHNIRKIIKDDPITPFTDRIKQLSDMGVSTVFVCGALGDYLPIADTVILMESFHAKDVTDLVVERSIFNDVNQAAWTKKRTLWIDRLEDQEIAILSSRIYGGNIVIGKYITDISRLSAITSKPQINSLHYSLLTILTHIEYYDIELSVASENAYKCLFIESQRQSRVLSPDEYWVEDIRPLDICCALNRINELHEANDIKLL